ncbi:RNA/RNP complex-1-interacting phosphatase [Kryptolebias marmoratus]|uniref:RNA/RNP complex-1-interacting phosphatase n=1 Tax=Kryptolebias marmoratus TaxID=37003 RepID=A0A3Q3BC38_KRYMA|nr:RNA/RNP complex-1-interacting phosphatase [Kryptolebias marmoratus]
MSRHKKNDIPDRWLDYIAVGKRLSGTRFIAFKVPLKQALNFKLPCSEVFGPWELLDALNKENQELGLIIDLTFTRRYYTPQDIPQSLLCVKIFTAGHEIPSDNTILSFKRYVHRFLQDNSDNDKLIGVHCTHGVNRTGYLICRYLIDVDGMDPEKAVELFNSSRGHAIERQNYLEDLKHGPKRSNKGIATCEQEPVRGEAVRRPSFTASDSGARFNAPEHHRSFAPQGSNHHPTHQGLFPRPPLLPTPPFHRPPSANPYRWVRGADPPPQGESWTRRSPYQESEWHPTSRLHKTRGRAAPPALPRYTPRWSSTSSSDGAAESGSWSRMRPPVKDTQRHDVNGYGSY